MAELRVRVTPRASRERIEVMPDGLVRAYVTAPPLEGVANEAVTALLSKRLRCPARDVRLVRGPTSRDKVFNVPGELADVVARLSEGAK